MVRLWVPALLLLTISQASFAQAAGAAKLVIIWNNGGIAVADYPSRQRCEVAVDALRRRFPDSPALPQRIPGGGVIISAPKLVEAFCIPG